MEGEEDAEKGGLYVLKVGVDWSKMVIKLPDRKVYTQLTVASKRRISDAMWSLSLDTEQLPWVLQGSQSLSFVCDTDREDRLRFPTRELMTFYAGAHISGPEVMAPKCY